MKLKFKNDNRSFSFENNSWARRYIKSRESTHRRTKQLQVFKLILETKAPNDKLLLGICLRGKTHHGETNITVICVPPNTHP